MYVTVYEYLCVCVHAWWLQSYMVLYVPCLMVPAWWLCTVNGCVHAPRRGGKGMHASLHAESNK